MQNQALEVVSLPPRKRAKLARRTKKPRKTEIGLWREWLVPDTAKYRRYPGLRGIYWYWLSRDVRRSEWERWGGKCLTCLQIVERWEDGQCGHIIASDGCGEYLRFNRINLTLQHAACNNPRITKHAAALNAAHYDQRYGPGSWERLYGMRKKEASRPTQDEYRALIRALPSYQDALIRHTQATPLAGLPGQSE